jgi:Peptidase family C25
MRTSLRVFGFLLLGAAPIRAADPPPQWLLVTASAYRQALEPLCEHRKADGFRVTVVQTTDVLTPKEILTGDARKLRDKVNQLCKEHNAASYVLLVGAVEPNGTMDEPESKVLPPLKGTTSRMKEQPSDHGYGSPKDDFVDAVAVGRFPARTAVEARQMVDKTIAFEKDTKPGEWRRRLTVLAGVPAFNPIADALVEKMALARLERIDPSWSGRAIYHNAASRFCLPDTDLHDRALEYVQAGQALTLYLGHSSPEGFWAGNARYLDRADWAKLAIPRGPGVFATFGCLGCQLCGQDGEGYGVHAMRNPRGPVAVIGSHGICFAAMVNLAADGLFESYLAGKPPERLGGCWLKVQEGLARGPMNALTFKLLDMVDGDPNIPEATQRKEHVEMFILLGDPALKLPALAPDCRLRLSGEAKPGATITITGEVSSRLEGAKVKLSLERPLTSDPPDLVPLPKEMNEKRDAVMRANHDRANRFALLTAETLVKDGRFEATFQLPEKLLWPRLLLRAYAATKDAEGIGVLSMPVRTGP